VFRRKHTFIKTQKFICMIGYLHYYWYHHHYHYCYCSYY